MTDTNPPADRTAEIRARLSKSTLRDSVPHAWIDYSTRASAIVRVSTDAETTEQAETDRALLRLAPTDLGYLLGRVEELERQLAKVGRIIEPRDTDWKPLSERYPQYFKAVSDEERARRNGWDQGVSLMSQRIKAVLDGTEPTTAPDSEMDPFEAADDIDRRCGS
jgi:hypothetical protein